MCVKNFVIFSISISLTLSSFAPNSWAQTEGANAPDLSIKDKMALQKQASGRALVKKAFDKAKTVPPRIPHMASALNEKLDNTAAGKLAKGGANKAALVFFTTISLLVAKEVLRKIKEEGSPLTAENAEIKYKEVEHEWSNAEQATHEALDAAILYPLIMSAEWGVEKISPKLSSTKFAGGLLHTFIIGIVLSGFNNLTDKIFFLSNEYLTRHPEIVGGVTEEEQIKLTLLEKRMGFSYFTRGLLFGDAVTKSAYGKLLTALSWTIFKEEELRGLLWSHALREYALNGAVITTIGASVVGGTIRSRIIPETSKFLKTKNTLFGFVVLAASAVLLPEIVQDKITFLTRRMTGLREQNSLSLDKIVNAKTEQDLNAAFILAKKERQSLANSALSVAKIANDRVLSLISEQKKLQPQINYALKTDEQQSFTNKIAETLANSYQLLFLESPATIDRLNGTFKKNDEHIKYYQSVIKYAFDTVSSSYQADIANIDIAFKTTKFINILATQRLNLVKLESCIERLSTTLTYQFNGSSPSFSRDPVNYSGARQILDDKAFLGYFEDNILLSL